MLHTMLASSEPVTWTAFAVLSGLAAAVPTTLLAWLHVRLNAMHKEHRAELQRVEAAIAKETSNRDRAIRQMHEHLTAQYVQKDALDAKFETVNNGVASLSARVGDFISLMQHTETKVDQHGEEIAALKAQRGE